MTDGEQGPMAVPVGQAAPPSAEQDGPDDLQHPDQCGDRRADLQDFQRIDDHERPGDNGAGEPRTLEQQEAAIGLAAERLGQEAQGVFVADDLVGGLVDAQVQQYVDQPRDRGDDDQDLELRRDRPVHVVREGGHGEIAAHNHD